MWVITQKNIHMCDYIELDRTQQTLTGTLIQQKNSLGMTSSNVLDDLLVFGTQEDNNWVKLGVVEPVHRIWGDVEQAVLASLHHLPNCG
jgi:hypothetical protein